MCGCFAFCTPHHTLGCVFGCFFVLGCYPVAVLVWEVVFAHTAYVGSMLRCVEKSVGVCWTFVLLRVGCCCVGVPFVWLGVRDDCFQWCWLS